MDIKDEIIEVSHVDSILRTVRGTYDILAVFSICYHQPVEYKTDIIKFLNIEYPHKLFKHGLTYYLVFDKD